MPRLTTTLPLALLAALLLATLAPNTHAAPATPAWPGEEGREAWEKLGAYYADQKAVIPWKSALRQLDSPNAATSKRAGKFLAALLAQSFADETNGRARWESFVGFGYRESSKSAARDFRRELAAAFGKSAKSPAALPAARWLLETELVPESQESGMTALCRINTPEADALLLEQLATPHPNATVLLTAINEAGNRKLSEAADPLAKLCQHPRSDIRLAAGAASLLLPNAKPQPPYDPAAAFSPTLAATLRDIARMAPPVPPDATWHLFTKIPTGAAQQAGENHAKFPVAKSYESNAPKTFSGWLCSETATDFVVIDYFAQSRTLPKSEWAATPETLAQTAQRLLDMRNTMPASQAEAFAQFSKRNDPNASFKPVETVGTHLSRGGDSTAQFEPAGISVPEALTAAWLFAREERADCAKLLFPRLEKLRDERWLREIARDGIGRVINEAMLEAFSYRRDYPATLTLARRLADPVFDGYAYHQLAIDLAAQLERTPEDFHTLTLPTPDEWTRLRATLSRDETIRYLAARLRLINSIQQGQPLGGVNYADTQYQTPLVGAVPEDKRVKVINPFNELLAMQLTASDLKLLLPCLAQRDYIPSFDFWRDFNPYRSLHHLDTVAAVIINQVAQRKLADPEKLNALDDAGRAASIAEIARWCNEHASLSASGLVLNTLRTATDVDEWLSAATLSTRQKPNDDAVEIICARANDFPKITEDTAKILYDSRSEKALPLARQWLSQTDPETRYWSALLVLTLDKEASKQEALQSLKKTLSEIDASKSEKQFRGGGYMDWKDYYRMRYTAAIDPLLSCGVPGAEMLALDILQQPFFLAWDLFGAEEKGAVLRRFLLAGYEEAYAFAQKNLDDDQPAIQFDNSGWDNQQGVPYKTYKTRMVPVKPFNTEWEGQRVTRQLHIYDYIADMAKYWRKDWKYEINAPEDVRRQKVAELKTWLAEQQEKIKRGEPSDIVQPPKPMSAW